MVQRGAIPAVKVGTGRTATLAFDPDDVERLADERAAGSVGSSLAASREAGTR